jgi:DNA-binding NarL/FixJ family response regulator
MTLVTCGGNQRTLRCRLAMTLSSLLVCVDDSAGPVLRQVLGELNIRVEACSDLARAAMRLAQERFDVVIFDCESQKEVTNLLRETRLSRLNDATLAVAVVPGQDNIREMFSLGVNFVLYKPVSHDRAVSSLRAARAVMRKEKRRNPRATVHTHATIDYADIQQQKATLVDLAQDGMCVRFGKKFPPTTKVYFQFKLPDQAQTVRLSGQVVWQDWNGRSGFQFVDVPKASRRLVTDFLQSVLPASRVPESVAGVAVEIEEPLLAVEVSAGQVSANIEKHDGVAQATVAGGAAAAARQRSEEGNRRDQVRYACRLGAQVYRTGISVPNHCCLTDLSSGGCYLEVSLPFPKGTSVEITVHTHEIKLRLRGKVQASHPGYGMGIAFELNTKEERDNVKQLTEFVAASAPSSENSSND